MGGIFVDNTEGADTFTIQTEVFRVRLACHDLMSLGEEHAEGVSILVQAARGEALVGRVKPGNVALGQDGIRDAFPLNFGGVDTGGVVSTGMEEKHGTIGGTVDVIDHTFVVQAFVCGVPIFVGALVDSCVAEDGVVSAPGRATGVHGLVGEEESDEFSTNAKRASSGQSLNSGNTAFFDGSAVAHEHSTGELAELGVTTLGEVFLVEIGSGGNFLFSSFDALQHKGFAFIGTVSTDTDVHFARVLGSQEQGLDAKDGVGGSLFNVIREGAGRSSDALYVGGG